MTETKPPAFDTSPEAEAKQLYRIRDLLIRSILLGCERIGLSREDIESGPMTSMKKLRDEFDRRGHELERWAATFGKDALPHALGIIEERDALRAQLAGPREFVAWLAAMDEDTEARRRVTLGEITARAAALTNESSISPSATANELQACSKLLQDLELALAKPNGSLYRRLADWLGEPLNRTDATSAADTAASAVHWFMRLVGERGYMHAEDDRSVSGADLPEVEAALPAVEPIDERGELERGLMEVIGERDEAQEWADKLAYAIAPVQVIGEHSNANNPWSNALGILEEQPQWEIDLSQIPEHLHVSDVQRVFRSAGLRMTFAPEQKDETTEPVPLPEASSEASPNPQIANEINMVGSAPPAAGEADSTRTTDERIEALQQSYTLKVADLARETARVSRMLRACEKSAVPRHVVGEAGLGYEYAQEVIRAAAAEVLPNTEQEAQR